SVNGTGTLIMVAERVGSETLLAQIVEMVAQAQRTRAPVQRLADTVAAWFVPTVVAIAIVTFVVWSLAGPEPAMTYALINAIAVLIIACPCALGLATPMSIMVAVGKGASVGVLFKNAEAIERLREIDTLVVDKTGTLTEGRPRVVSIVAAGTLDEAKMLAAAASLEAGSEHPLASAIVDAARERGIPLEPVEEFESLTGKGVVGVVGGTRTAVGNRALLETLGLEPGDLDARAEALRAEGQTVMYLVHGTTVAGLFGVADRIKATTREALDLLREDGVHLVMVTGDNPTTAKAVAARLGIDDVIAGVLPDRKAEIVASLRAKGRKVAMAGDGINDAPALATADVG